MDDQQARALGAILKKKREETGISMRKLAAIVGFNNASILRLERGELAAPAPDKLARLAAALEIPLADIYALADYAVPDELPSFKPYLRTKYRDLPQEEVDKIEAYAQKLAQKHGVNLKGPAPGEDE